MAETERKQIRFTLETLRKLNEWLGVKYKDRANVLSMTVEEAVKDYLATHPLPKKE